MQEALMSFRMPTKATANYYSTASSPCYMGPHHPAPWTDVGTLNLGVEAPITSIPSFSVGGSCLLIYCAFLLGCVFWPSTLDGCLNVIKEWALMRIWTGAREGVYSWGLHSPWVSWWSAAFPYLFSGEKSGEGGFELLDPGLDCFTL